MGHLGENANTDYGRLRAAYDAAFHRLCTEIRWLRCVAQDPNSNEAPREAARRSVDEAFRAYRACRDQLAECLMSVKPAEMAMAAGASFAGSAGRWATSSQAGEMNDGPLECRDELQFLAYRLWEEAGRPVGKPDEYWYRAERLLRCGP